MKLSKRVGGLKASATLAVTGKAKQMASEGIDVVSLSAGEPDFNVPDAAVAGVLEALSEKRNRYTQVPGIPELRAAVAEKLSKENGLAYDPDEIVMTVGAKQALFNAMQALLDEGDEVLVPEPYWVSYPAQIELAGGTLVPVPCRAEDGFRLDPAAVDDACTARTRALLLTSPNNPTGAVYAEQALAEVANIAMKRDLFVISDEIYENLVYGDARHVSIVSLDPGMKERALVVNGFSKSWAMPGWRLGYAAGPKPLIQAMTRIQGHATSNPTSLVQYAALAVLGAGRDSVNAMRDAFDQRRRAVCERLQAIEGLSVPVPEGAFYVMPDARGLLPAKFEGQALKDDTDLALALLEKAHVATVPGGAFGAPGCLRLSYAASMEDLEKACDRIEAFVARLER